MHRVVVSFWSLVLIATGLAILAHKSIYLGLPLVSNAKTEIWTVQARLSFISDNRNVKATLHIPNVTPGYVKLDEHYISGNFGLNAKMKGDNKTANWAVRKAKGEQILYYRTTEARSDTSSNWVSDPNYPTAPEFDEPYSMAVEKIIKDVRSQSADIASFTYELITQLHSPDSNENISLLKSLANSDEDIANLVIKLLAVAHIPTRKLWIIGLADAANNVKPQVFIQVHNDDEWISFDPKTAKT